jgi:hypothetical protein
MVQMGDPTGGTAIVHEKVAAEESKADAEKSSFISIVWQGARGIFSQDASIGIPASQSGVREASSDGVPKKS